MGENMFILVQKHLKTTYTFSIIPIFHEHLEDSLYVENDKQ